MTLSDDWARRVGDGCHPFVDIYTFATKAFMANLIHLSPGEKMPDCGDDEPWLVVDASDDGRFFGTGVAWKPTGGWVGYCSLPEDDGSLADALVAAENWALKYSVSTIWVQITP